jgi:sugar phosphate isomerase/epimerase
MIYKTFEQWKSGNVLEHGVSRTSHYSEDQLDLVEMGWNYGYDAGRAVEQALDKKAENARELGLDYEPVGLIDRLKRNEMTDRELLELAAKSAGIEVVTPTMLKYGQWNPLTDDGDAFRLAVKLGMQITIILDGDDGDHFPQTMVDWATEEHLNDPYAATRRAITRAAAEIGKEKMP